MNTLVPFGENQKAAANERLNGGDVEMENNVFAMTENTNEKIEHSDESDVEMGCNNDIDSLMEDDPVKEQAKDLIEKFKSTSPESLYGTGVVMKGNMPNIKEEFVEYGNALNTPVFDIKIENQNDLLTKNKKIKQKHESSQRSVPLHRGRKIHSYTHVQYQECPKCEIFQEVVKDRGHNRTICKLPYLRLYNLKLIDHC